MKRVKKLLSLVLAMMLVLAMGSTAMAAPEDGETGTITIKKAIEGQTYTIYKMFNLKSYNKDNDAYMYEVADGWSDFITTGDGKDYVEVKEGTIVWKDETLSPADFAKAALKYATDNGIQPAKDPIVAESETVVFENLDLGYYLLDSTTGALCSLDTTNPTAEIEEKNEKPTIEKEVEQPSASIGDTVNYMIKIKIAPGAQDYEIHDQMSEGLTFSGVEKLNIKVLDATTVKDLSSEENKDARDQAIKDATGEVLVKDTDYTITAPATDGHTFDIVFTEGAYAKMPAGGMIVVSYEAVINAEALDVDEVTNKATLKFGDDNEVNSTETPDVPTKFIDVNILKFAKTNSGETGLDGAEFTLSKNEDGTDPISFVDLTNGNYRVATKEDATTTTTVVSPAGTDIGKINLDSLGAGTYYLTETKAPDGYNLLKAPVKIVITETKDTTTGEITLTVQIPDLDDDGNVKTDEEGNELLVAANPVKVQNMTGAELPSTGGIGTTIFYVLGGILVVGAGILLVVKKRMSSEK